MQVCHHFISFSSFTSKFGKLNMDTGQQQGSSNQVWQLHDPSIRGTQATVSDTLKPPGSNTVLPNSPSQRSIEMAIAQKFATLGVHPKTTWRTRLDQFMLNEGMDSRMSLRNLMKHRHCTYPFHFERSQGTFPLLLGSPPALDILS